MEETFAGGCYEVFFVVPAEQWRQTDSDRYGPDDADVGERSAAGGAPVTVPDRVNRGGVAIGRDDAQVPDGRRAAKNVDDQPDTAGDASERPVTKTLVSGREREDRHRQQEVASSEVADQTVGDSAQRSVTEQSDEDEQVAEDGEDD